MHQPPIEEADGNPSSRDRVTPAPGRGGRCRCGRAGITLVSFEDFNPRASRQLERVR
jgi:hypothetical protein